MVLNSEDPETDRVARELAAATGESITVATCRALEERLRRVRAAMQGPDVEQVLLGIVERARREKPLDDRTPDEILGYDEHRLPT